jgi:serine/threonine protein kinase
LNSHNIPKKLSECSSTSDIINYIKKYEINKINIDRNNKIGKGAYAEVFKVKLKEGAPPLAIKQINFKNFSNNCEDMVHQETKIMIMLNETNAPNTVRFHGYFYSEFTLTYHICMDYFPNGSLNDNLNALDEEKQHKIMLGLSYALQHLHSHNIVHCDIKPGNVLLEVDWTARLGDFGLSYVMKDNHTRALEKGTPFFNAPEILLCQWKRKKDCLQRPGVNDKETDIYSLGLTFWCVVAKRQFPYTDVLDGENGLQMLAEKVAVRKEREMIPESCPPYLSSLIEHCWADNRAERPEMTKVVKELEEGSVMKAGMK